MNNGGPSSTPPTSHEREIGVSPAMNANQTHNENFGELIQLIRQLPPSERAAALLSAVSFQPAENLEESFAIGPLRAAWADEWERLTGEPVPVGHLRSLLEPPLPIGTVLSFLQLNGLGNADEISTALEEVFVHLQNRLQRETGAEQLPLFESTPQIIPLADNRLPCSGENVNNLGELVEQDVKFSTIYADPPWSYENNSSRAAAVNHYPTLSLDDICNEPVSKLTTDNAHLHLWTTNAFLRESFQVIEAWGFNYKSCLVWVKPELGMGNYWRVSHEYLILGVKGSLTFADRTQGSWIMAPRTTHSRKPAAVRSIIEKVSPGPYLELYGRQALPHSAWTVYGNKIERGLF